ncbi:hypothetical protein EJ05DRAFT_128632 [Pseudovirgaria hyperparasitica]|uniref:RING-type domain-containing protein n=1 Tax=Pseudovirgaria hyperparasitica TaxID=470096 RepID=A0A6A6VZK7_9PEZI|nr:uncharacterized protein EJ05DRAFT_128632 [Pseudovirgaria hyperparasitica]KAF2755286.1 hypothetical protein EJ05DRAFT_128632 [Pseudovirgaria hyperparasitica]
MESDSGSDLGDNTPNAARWFLLRTPTVPSIPDEACNICLRPFDPTNAAHERPVVTACGHRFGRDCLAVWLSTPCPGSASEKRFSDSCPCCRAVLFAQNDAFSLLSPPPSWHVRFIIEQALRDFEEVEARLVEMVMRGGHHV